MRRTTVLVLALLIMLVPLLALRLQLSGVVQRALDGSVSPIVGFEVAATVQKALGVRHEDRLQVRRAGQPAGQPAAPAGGCACGSGLPTVPPSPLPNLAPLPSFLQRPGQCLDDHPWIRGAVDHFFQPAWEAARATNQTVGALPDPSTARSKSRLGKRGSRW